MKRLAQHCLAGLIVACTSFAAAAADEKVLIEWKFDKPGDFRGWQPNGEIAKPVVADGALSGRAKGSDPILMGPVFEIPATAKACVEIRMKATAAASSELYWTETLQGKFGGFSSTKHRAFVSQGDGQFHDYRIYPFWMPAKKIVRLRVDPPNDGEFAIAAIRVVDEATAAPTDTTAWNAEQFRQQWQPCRDVSATAEAPILFSPAFNLPAADYAFVALRMTCTGTGTGKLFAVSRGQAGWDSMTFPLRGDGQPHTYNLDVSPLKNWQSKLLFIGLQLPAGSDTQVDAVEIARDPSGPAELNVAYFGPTDGINRAGRECGVTCTLRNYGGQRIGRLTATLEVPPGVELLDAPQKTVEKLSLYLPQTIAWKIKAAQPGRIEVGVTLAADGQSSLTRKATLDLTPAPVVPKTGYVPEPQPVASDYDVGTYYFPGWHTAARWRPIRDWPNRKPILGWYDENNPECADWQIKWAVEHGVNFFMVDWYWCQGARHLEHWLHNAYAKARYKRYLKWAVMWANHNPPQTHSVDDWKQVTQYWIDNYFSMPEYYRLDGRPVVFIWSPRGIRSDLGGSQAAAGLYALSQKMAQAAGHKGIYFIAMNTDNRSGELKAEGFDAFTSYHGFELARRTAGSDRFPFSLVAETAKQLWQTNDEHAGGLNYLPIVDTGWDARPWHGDKTIVVSGRTPELFGQMCRQARHYADATGKRIIALGPWNEWGEGSYIEPYAEYGFADLDQVRAAFCKPGNWPPNLIPSDVGLGPYDLPALPPKTRWEFNTDGDAEGWTSNGQVADLAVRGGSLAGRSTGRDPTLSVGGMQVEADQLHRLRFRFRADKAGQVQIFWATTLTKMSGQTVINIDTPGDNAWHDYDIDLAKHRNWRGVITDLRFDPTGASGVSFALDSIDLY